MTMMLDVDISSLVGLASSLTLRCRLRPWWFDSSFKLLLYGEDALERTRAGALLGVVLLAAVSEWESI